MKKIIGIFIVTLLICTVVSQVSACTGFTYSDNDDVFACHNEDWHDFFTLRFFPATEDRFGTMFIEVWDDWAEALIPFSGMNEKGLWYSMYACPYLAQKNLTDLPYYYDPDSFYKIHPGEPGLFTCATIEEAMELGDQYNHNAYCDFQVLSADGTGNSIINEGDIRIFKEGSFQVVTNFRQSHPELGGYPCERYETVVSMLENMTEPSVEYFRDICNATHREGSWSWTCHSIICDLSNQIMYIYYFGDYEKQVVIDLSEELEKGEHSIFLGSLFEPEDNQPPAKPEPPKGNESGIPGEVIEYRARITSDPEGDKIAYMFDWGDGSQSIWDYCRFGFSISSSHSWAERGTYEIKVKAMDQYGAESEWSDPLAVTVPKTRIYNPIFTLLYRLFDQYPFLELLL